MSVPGKEPVRAVHSEPLEGSLPRRPMELKSFSMRAGGNTEGLGVFRKD